LSLASGEEGYLQKPGTKNSHSSPSKAPKQKRRKEHGKQQEAAKCKCKCKHLGCVQTANMYSSKASKQASKPENVGASVFFTFHEFCDAEGKSGDHP